MRCRVGELAIYVGAPRFRRYDTDCLGCVVRCVALISDGEDRWDASWKIEPALPFRHLTEAWDECADSLLRPLRAQSGEDESLSWAGKPVETPRDVIRELSRESK